MITCRQGNLQTVENDRRTRVAPPRYNQNLKRDRSHPKPKASMTKTNDQTPTQTRSANTKRLEDSSCPPKT